MVRREHLNTISYRVIGLCLEVHRELGPGLLESAYEEALAFEFARAGMRVDRQLDTPLTYSGTSLNCGYRLDFPVEDEVILEIKAVEEIVPVHRAQIMTYLRLKKCSLGLLINFNVPVLRDGINRVVSGDLFRDE